MLEALERCRKTREQLVGATRDVAVQHDEHFVAAVAPDDGVLGEVAAHGIGQRAQRGIAHSMAVHVVDDLEIVDVEQRQHVRLVGVICHLLFRRHIDAAAVQQSRERVVLPHVLQAVEFAPLVIHDGEHERATLRDGRWRHVEAYPVIDLFAVHDLVHVLALHERTVEVREPELAEVARYLRERRAGQAVVIDAEHVAVALVRVNEHGIYDFGACIVEDDVEQCIGDGQVAVHAQR